MLPFDDVIMDLGNGKFAWVIYAYFQGCFSGSGATLGLHMCQLGDTVDNWLNDPLSDNNET